VVAETATRLRYDGGTKTALRFRALIERALESGRLRIEWIDETVHNDGWKLLERYADMRLSMTDVTSASVARAAKITTVFGFDSDFRALGFDLQPV
jgi:predicted nucleic acid-binding protein